MASPDGDDLVFDIDKCVVDPVTRIPCENLIRDPDIPDPPPAIPACVQLIPSLPLEPAQPDLIVDHATIIQDADIIDPTIEFVIVRGACGNWQFTLDIVIPEGDGEEPDINNFYNQVNFFNIVNFFNETVNFFTTVNFYDINNFYSTNNFYSITNYYGYFTWQPIFISNPTTGIILDPGTAPKLQIITGPFVVVDEQQLGHGNDDPVPEIQRVWVVNATGGTFDLILTSADVTETAAAISIPWNATAVGLQTILNAAAAATFTIPYTVTVTGDGTVGSPWIVTYSGFDPYALMLPRYDPLTGSTLEIEYTGIDPGPGDANGRIIVIEAVGPGRAILDDASDAAAAAAYADNMAIFWPLGKAYSLWGDCGVTLEYDKHGDGVHGGWRVIHQTYGSSSLSDADLVYACNRTYFGAGLTHTPNNNGTSTVSVNWVEAPVPCLVNNQVGGATTISDGSMTLSTLSLTIPSDGVYKIIVRVSTSALNTLGTKVISAQGFLIVNGSIIQNDYMFDTSLEPKAAGAITFDYHSGFSAGQVIKAACQILPAESGRSFRYTISYLKICGSGGS